MPEAHSSEEIDRIGSPAWPLIVGVEGPHVTIGVAGESYVLDAGDQEKFAQAYVAACHQAKANAAQAARDLIDIPDNL